MAMTKEERATRDYLAEKLGEQGYATYAKLFMLFDLRLTSDPRYVGFMEPGKGRITLNRTLAEHQMGLIIRHEILHEYLSHEMRLLDHLAEKYPDMDPDDISLKNILYGSDIYNIAADYEISNRGYTERDKQDVRNIQLGGQVVSGLVTEDKHPDWVDKTVEEMYDLLQDEREKAKEEAEQDLQDQEEDQDNEQQDQQQGQESDSGEGQSGESDSEEEGESGESDGESSDESDEEESDESGRSGNSGDNQDSDEDQDGEGESGESGDDSQEGDSQGSGESKDGESDESEEEEGEPQQNNSSGSSNKGNKESNSPADNRSKDGSKSSNNGEDIKVVRGTFKDGKFYGLDGKEINPGA